MTVQKQPLTEDQLRIIEKVQKIMAVAGDGAAQTTAEAHQAVIMCQKLMIAHGLDMKHIEVTGALEEKAEDMAFATYTKEIGWLTELSSVLARNFRCKTYRGRTTKNGKRQFTRQFIGMPSDLAMLQEIFNLLLLTIDQLANSYIAQSRRRAGAAAQQWSSAYLQEMRLSWITGFVQGLEHQFVEQQKTYSASQALVLVMPKQVDEHYRGLGLGTYRSAPLVTSHSNANQHGYITGKNWNNAKQLTA